MRDFISLYLTEFKSHVISFTGLHKNNAVYKRICRGKALTQMPVCRSHVTSEHGKDGVDVFSIRKQDLCLWTGSLCHKGSEKSHPAWIALLALFNFFFTFVASLFKEGAKSPRLSWSCQSSVYTYGSPLLFWPLSFSWENIWNIGRSISLFESAEFYFKRRFRESTSRVIDEILHDAWSNRKIQRDVWLVPTPPLCHPLSISVAIINGNYFRFYPVLGPTTKQKRILKQNPSLALASKISSKEYCFFIYQQTGFHRKIFQRQSPCHFDWRGPGTNHIEWRRHFRRFTRLLGLKYLHHPSYFVLNILTLCCNV